MNKNKQRIHVSIPERTGANSACEVSLSIGEDSTVTPVGRPKTHEGFRPSAPATPGKERGSNKLFLSPRQVAVKLVPEVDVGIPANQNSSSLKPSTTHLDYSEPAIAEPIHTIAPSLVDIIENSLPNFVKKSRTPAKGSRERMSSSAPAGLEGDFGSSGGTGTGAVKSMYPSLGSRLNATIVDARPRTAVQLTTPLNRTNVIKSDGYHKQTLSHRLYNAPNTFGMQQQQHQPRRDFVDTAATTLQFGGRRGKASTAAGERSVTFERSSLDFMSPSTQQQQAFPAPQFYYDSTPLKGCRLFVPNQSTTSTVFPQMDIEDMLDYLLEAREEGSKRAPFIHVTPRHNLEKVKKLNFYDLVALERPGVPKSGVVWVKGSASAAEKERLLKPHQVMQLSLFGLSVNHEDERGLGCVAEAADDVPNEIVPVKEFLLEKSQFNYLRTGRFFGLFREMKIFKAWHAFARHQVTRRIRATLLSKTIFSDVELIACVAQITRVTYELENDLEFFAFHGCGAMCVTDFLSMQINRNKMTSLAINKVVNQLGETMQQQYNQFVGGAKLAKQLQHVKDHHPAGKKRHFPKNEIIEMAVAQAAAAAGAGVDAVEEEVEWEKYRSMQRFTEEFREKLKLVLNLAQFRIESTLALCLEKFWLRMKQLIVGVKKVKFDKKFNLEHFWKVDPTLFDEEGHISHLTLSHYCGDLFPHLVQEEEEQQLMAHRAAAAAAASQDNNNYYYYNEDGGTGGEDPLSSQVPFVMDESTLSGPPPPVVPAAVAEHQQKTDNLAALLTSLAAVRFSSNDEHHVANRHVDGIKVTSQWEEEGSHLCLNVNLTLDKNIVSPTDLLTLTAVDRVKVSVLPSRTQLMTDMYQLCGSLGALLESIPDLRKHPLIYDSKLYDARLVETAPTDLDLPEANHPLSKSFFTCLVSRPIYNSRGAANHAVETIRLMQCAYLEAAELDAYLFRLFEIVRKLWSISPSVLTRQLEKSLSLVKVKEYIEDPDAVDDLHRSNNRDKNRLSTFRTAAVYLEELNKLLNTFLDIKHTHGMISSFKPVLEQISTYRLIQHHLLFSKLPTSYSIRCSVLYDFLRKLEMSYEVVNPTLDKHIRLMRRLRNFELCKESFDVEWDVCDSMYYLIEGFEEHNILTKSEDNNNSPNSEAALLKELISGILSSQPAVPSASSSVESQPVISAVKLYRICIDQKDRLFQTMSRARSSLLSQLSTIKADSIAFKQDLLTRIVRTSGRLASFKMDPSSGEVSLSEVTQMFDLLGKEVRQLRSEVDASITGQMVLTEAHDIIGAANAVLVVADVEKYNAMEGLETAYSHRSKAWKCIVDAGHIKYQLYVSRLVNNSISELAAQFNSIVSTHSFLCLNTTGEAVILKQIKDLMDDLRPKVHLLSYLSSKTLRHRHWRWLSEYVMSCCGLNLTFTGIKSEFISVLDVTKGKDPLRLGSVFKLPFNEFVNRGIEVQVDKVSSITAEAVIESMLEHTLDAVEEALRSSFVQTSGEWLRDSRLREKIFLELNEMVNLVHMSILVKFSMKTIMIVDSTSQDMCLSTFNHRIETLKDRVQKIEQFIDNMQEIQREWMYVLHFAKFSVRGEISRDAGRLYNTCTEDIKKIETSVAQNGLNLYDAFSIPGFDQELHSDALRLNLTTIMDDAQSSVQSMLDACPRLSLMTYNRVVSLVKAWMLGPQGEMDLLSTCMHDMFEGVGELTVKVTHGQRLFACSGFISSDRLEVVRFQEVVPFTLSLDEFVKEFDRQLRLVMEKSCDVLILHRIACLKALLNDTQPHVVVENMGNVFSQRTCQLLAMISESHLNQTYYLINFVSFAEDVWTCLGFPTGCLAIARGDLILENSLFSSNWRGSLNALLLDCKENVSKLQDMLAKGQVVGKASRKKCRALLSSLLLQEISFLKVTEELLACKCLESVSELWASRYQLKFQYSKEYRLCNSPIDVIMGSVNVSYGMEYCGAHIRSIPDVTIEAALLKVMGAAFSSRGSVFISYDDQNSLFEVPGEYSVSCRDISCALGRLSTTLVSSSHPHAVRFFVARLVYLDAVGCVDFTSIDHSSLHVLTNTLNSIWRCLDSKNDNYMQDSLRFPLKTKFTRNDLQMERRKNSIAELRNSIAKRRQSNTYCGFIVLGMASEIFYSNLSVFDHFYRSIFNAISISHNRPIDKLGVLLTSEGFFYGMELQTTLQNTLVYLTSKYTGQLKESLLVLVHRLCTSLELQSLVEKVSRTLSLFQLSKRDVPGGRVGRFKVEMQCFTADLWEAILLISSGENALVASLRRDLFSEFVQKYMMISTKEEALHFQSNIGGTCLLIQGGVNISLIKSALQLGLICNHAFIEKCALFWKLFSSSNNNVMILSGESAVGKSSVMSTVFAAIRRSGLHDDVIFGDPWPIICRRSARIIFHALRSWFIYKLTQASAANEQDEIDQVLREIEENQQLHRQQSGDHTVGRRASMDESDRGDNMSEGENTAVREQGSLASGGPAGPLRTKTVSFSMPLQPPLYVKGRGQKGQPHSDHGRHSEDLQPIQVSLIYHASLSVTHLLGSYDTQGRWTDGVLVRKLRCIDREIQLRAKKPISFTEAKSLYVIVLNGPIGFYVEQLFADPFYQSHAANIPRVDSCTKTLILPTGEMHSIPPEVKVVLETNDIENASPACFVYVPALRLTIGSDICISRLLHVWMRSLYHWLGDFPPWIDFIDELNRVLLHTKFVEDLLYCDSTYTVADIPSVVIVSRISAFLRYLEELLKETHDLALSEASFVESEEKDILPVNTAMDDESSTYLSEGVGTLESIQFNSSPTSAAEAGKQQQAAGQAAFTYKGVMTLGSKARDRLVLRARLSVVYAALWGFGGTVNSTDKRRLFENAVRDGTQMYFDSLDLSEDYSLFDCIFNIKLPAITLALQIDLKTNSVLTNEGVSLKSDFAGIYVDLFADNASNKQHHRLVFRTPATRAVDASVRLLMMTGSNVLLLGPKNCGKSMMLTDILNDLKKHCATPHDMRNHVIENLMDVVNGTKKPEGIFAAMEILKHVLREFSSLEVVNDSTADFDRMWQTAGTALKTLWCGDARINCRAKTVASNITSLRGAPTAQSLRTWFEREFATETKYVLETSRFSYGVAFIDDLHLCAQQSEAVSDMRMLQDRPESLLKGVLAGTPLFTLKRNVSVRNPMTLGDHHGSMTASYHSNKGELPVMHKELLTDPRLQSADLLSDNYILQRMGIVTAATGDFNSLVRSSFFNQLMTHLTAVSLPTISVAELHVCLSAGAYVSMSGVSKAAGVIEVLKNEISELSRFTFNMCKRMISSTDVISTSLLERSIRSLVIVDVSLVSRFCLSLQYGINNISNPGGLLQLYAHEWKRYFLDPLPHGTQRNRIIALLNEQLDTIDVKLWSVTADWIKSLQEDFAAHKDRVWTDASVFKTVSSIRKVSPMHSVPQSPVNRGAANAASAFHSSGHVTPTIGENIEEEQAVVSPVVLTGPSEYLPVELERAGTEQGLLSGSWSAAEGRYLPILEADEIGSNTITKVLDFTGATGAGDLRKVLYPAAVALVLRMVRILSVADKHLLLSGYLGTSRITALHLAAKICDRDVECFDVKDTHGVVEQMPSERASTAANFQKFLKLSILKAAGLQMVTSEPVDQFSRSVVSFEVVEPQRVMVVISSAQQLSDDDRRLLLNLVDYEDPGWLFDDGEILGITDALRHMLLTELNKATDGFEIERNAAVQRLAKAAAGRNTVSVDESVTHLEAPILPALAVLSVPLTTVAHHEKRMTTMDAVLVNPRKTPSAAAAAGLESAAAAANQHQYHQIFTGYSFQWVKKYLQDHIQLNLSLVIDTDIPRTVKLESSSNVGQSEVFALLKKKPAVPNDKKALAASAALGGSVLLGRSKVTTKQRFSLHSNRSTAASATTSNAVAPSNRFLQYNPLMGQNAGETVAAASSHAAAESTGAQKSDNSSGSRGGSAASQTVLSIFTCPILGPMLSRRFFSLWYDVDSMDAVKGICHTKMKNEEAFNQQVIVHSSFTPSGSTALGAASVAASPFSPQSRVPAASPVPYLKQGEEASAVLPPPPSRMSSLVLCLRTSTLGYYLPTTEDIGGGTMSNIERIKKLSKSEMASIDREESRKRRFKATAVLNSYNILLKSSYHLEQNAIQTVFSAIPHLGVFRSFATHLPLSDSQEKMVQFSIATFIEEARAVLPFMLSAPLPSDALILTEPVLSPGPEAVAELAADQVCLMIRHGARVLMTRKLVLQTVAKGYEEALIVLDNTVEIDEKLAENNEALLKIVRKLNKEVDSKTQELFCLDETFSASAASEAEQMLLADIESLYVEIFTLENQMEEMINEARKAIFRFVQMDWQNFALHLSGGKPLKTHLELMRAVMVVINFTPPKVVKGEKGAGASSGGKMDDEAVARYGLSLLAKSDELASNLCTLTPTILSVNHVNALRIMNMLMNSSLAEHINAEKHSALAIFAWVQANLGLPAPIEREPEEMVTALTPNNIYETLLYYLILVEVYVGIFAETASMRNRMASLEAELHTLVEVNVNTKIEMCNALKETIDALNQKVHHVSEGLLANKAKMAVIERNENQKAYIRKGLVESRAFVEEETIQIDSVLRTLVADTCVGVTVMLRAGWLSEQIRQEAMEQLRIHLRLNHLNVSETPFLLGCLVDRLQMRQWTSFSEHSLSRDPASINAMSLVLLAPTHVMIIDPDGVSAAVLNENILTGYDQFVIIAQRFSLSVFENWLTTAVEINKASGVSLVVTDLQAGVSDDLVCLLSSDLMTDEEGCVLIRTGGGSSDPSGFIRLPCQLRVHLVSTKMPTMDAYGVCRPLPSCCLKRVTVIQWSVTTSAPVYVDSKPLQAALEQTNVSDHALGHKLAALLCNAITPNHLSYSSAINHSIIQSTENLYHLEQEVIASVFVWMNQKRAETVEELVIDDLVEQAPVSLSFLSDEAVLQLILTVINTRRELNIDIEMNKSLLRELISYFSCLSEVFSMSVDFLRMCGTFLPREMLTPYALSVTSLCTNFAHNAIERAASKNFLKGIPPSLADMKHFSKKLTSFQRHFRKVRTVSGLASFRLKSTNSSSSLSVSRRASTASAVGGGEASSGGRRVSVVHKIDNEKKRFGLMSNSRQIAMNEINFILMPLRAFFLREAVGYMSLCIRPGLEWLVKFLLTISTWAQSSALPVEELRALMYLVQQSSGHINNRYSFFMPFNGAEGSVGTAAARASTVSLVEGVKRMRTSTTVSFTNMSSASARNSTASVSATIIDNSDEDEEESEDQEAATVGDDEGSEEEFLEQLPGTRSIASRATAFRINESKKIPSDPTGRQSVRFSKLYKARHTTRGGKGAAASALTKKSLRWMDRGLGSMDGLWINTRSERWKVTNSEAGGRDATMHLAGCHILLDGLQSDLAVKNRMVRPTVRMGDPFEVDWQRLRGVKIFGTAGTLVGGILGATGQEDIAALRRASSSRLSFMMKAPDSSPGMTNNSKRNSLLALMSAGGTNKKRKSTIHRKSVLLKQQQQKDYVGNVVDVPKDSLTSRHSRLSFKIKPPITITQLPPSSTGSGFSAVSSIQQRASIISAAGRHLKGVDASTVRMTSMSAGIGEHRASLMALKSHRASVLAGAGKFSRSLSSAGSASDDHSSRMNEPIVDDLADLVTNPAAYQNIILLEQHNSLAAVFKGMTVGINRNIYDFADWKDNISQLCSVDAHKLIDADLDVLVGKVKPPMFDDIDDETNNNTRSDTSGGSLIANEDGLWAKGKELTILQSILFSEALIPGSAGSIADVFFAVVASFLKKEGHIVQNVDETSPEEEEDDDMDMGEEQEEGDSVSGSEKGTRRHSLAEDSVGSNEGDAFDAENRAGAARVAKFIRNVLVSEAAKKQQQGSRASPQEGVAFINCWSKMERLLKGRSTYRGPQRELPDGTAASAVSRYSSTARDFNDWESVLLDVLCEDTTIDKFTFMKGLRDSMNGVKSSVFLSNHLSTSQIAVFSQRARDLSMHNSKHLSIINCGSEDGTGGSRVTRAALSEVIKTIKAAVGGAVTGNKKAMIERINLKASFGNSVLNSVLLHGGHSASGLAMKSHIAADHKVTHLTIRAELLHRKDSLHEVHHFKTPLVGATAGGAGGLNFTSTGNYKKAEPKPWFKTFPLLLSSEWGEAQSTGCGPFVTLAELNYIWLPRYFAPDIIKKTVKANYTTFDSTTSAGQGLPPSVMESCGVLCEELETSLLWVMNSNRSISRSRVTDEIRQRLKFAGKFEIRATSCLITIWQLMLYLRSSNREESGMVGLWSSCLNPVSLWQLSRLIIKTSDILKVVWKTRVPLNPYHHEAQGRVPPVVIVSELITQPRFVKAIALLVESFSHGGAGCDLYSTNYGKSSGPTAAASAAAAVPQRLSMMRLSMMNKRKSAVNVSTPATAGASSNAATSSNAGEGQSTNALSAAIKAAAPKPKDSQRARKQMKKMLKKQEELRVKYVQQLSSVEKFAFSVSGSDTGKSAAVDKEFIDRFVSFAGVFMAEVVAELTTSEVMHTKVFGEKTTSSFSNFITVALNARKQSSKMNIKSFLDEVETAAAPQALGGGPGEPEGGVNWPTIEKANSLDVSIGSLQSKDIIKCMVRWTFDGSNGGARKLKHTVDKKMLFEAVKKLSLRVKAGEVKL